MQYPALLAREKQTNGVHRCSARAGMGKKDCKLVWTLNLYLYKSHPTVNSERSGNTGLFIRFFLRKAKSESCESYQNFGGPFSILTDPTQVSTKEFSLLLNFWDSVPLVLLGHRGPGEALCPISSFLLLQYFL